MRPCPIDHLGNRGRPASIPHGVWLTRGDDRTFLGAVFSTFRCGAGDEFTRPSAGGGGYGDPLERDPAAVRDDVADGYVSIERARKDYGVVVLEVDAELAEYEVDADATVPSGRIRRSGAAGWRTIPRPWPRATAAG